MSRLLYWIQPYIPVEVEDPEMFTNTKDIEAELEHLRLLQPENHYEIMIKLEY
jgi:hypothetical protein